jgi:hypothetical protein
MLFLFKACPSESENGIRNLLIWLYKLMKSCNFEALAQNASYYLFMCSIFSRILCCATRWWYVERKIHFFSCFVWEILSNIGFFLERALCYTLAPKDVHQFTVVNTEVRFFVGTTCNNELAKWICLS